MVSVRGDRAVTGKDEILPNRTELAINYKRIFTRPCA